MKIIKSSFDINQILKAISDSESSMSIVNESKEDQSFSNLEHYIILNYSFLSKLDENQLKESLTGVNVESKESDQYSFITFLFEIILQYEIGRKTDVEGLSEASCEEIDNKFYLFKEKTEISHKIVHDLVVSLVLFVKILSSFKQQNTDECISYQNTIEQMTDQVTFPFLFALSQFYIGSSFYIKQEYDNAVKHYLLAYDIIQKHNYSYKQMSINNNLGICLMNLNDFTNAIDYLVKANNFAIEADNKIFEAITSFNIALCNLKIGNLDNADIHFLSANETFLEIGNSRSSGFCLLNIGTIYYLKGELHQAIAFCEQALKQFQDANDLGGQFSAYNNQGLNYQRMGDIAIAYQFFLQAYNIIKAETMTFEKEKVLYNLYTIALELIETPTKENLYRLYYDEITTLPDSGYQKLATAKQLRRSKRLRNLVKAEDLYREILNASTFDHEILTIASLELTDMLIQEFKDSRDLDLLEDIGLVLKRLVIVADEQSSYWLQAQILILRAKLAIFNYDSKGAREFMKEAENLANKHQYTNLEKLISQELDKLLEPLEQIDLVVDSSVDTISEIGIESFADLLKTMINNRMDQPEFEKEIPNLFFLTYDSVEIYSYVFSDDMKIDQALLANLISAFNSAIADAFAAEGSVERVKHNEKTLLQISFEKFVFAYVIEGASFYAKRKLDVFFDLLQSDTDVWERLNAEAQKSYLSANTIDFLDRLMTSIFLNEENQY